MLRCRAEWDRCTRGKALQIADLMLMGLFILENNFPHSTIFPDFFR